MTHIPEIINHTNFCVYTMYMYSLISVFQGVGGAVHLPRGFLKKAFEAARESGGVCVADEV